jgi:UDP-N-acetylmuramate--alanine ligase
MNGKLMMQFPAGSAERSPSAHLVGICGAGMRAVAAVLLERGWQITGSDLHPQSAGALVSRGARVFSGHASSHLPADTDLLIYSEAVSADNSERQEAQRRGIAIRSYGQILGEIAASCQTAGSQVLAVAGTHGKSTVTAMIAAILTRAGMDPTIICGASPVSGHQGDGKITLIEACEYRENFLHLRPNVATLLNVEHDHFDCYQLAEQLQAAFSQFALQTRDDGLIVASNESASAIKIAASTGRRMVTFGFSRSADWCATNLEHSLGRYRFNIVRHGQKLAHITLTVPGRHNVLNALAAAVVARHCGASGPHIAQGLAAFRGLKRRLEPRGRWAGVPWIDDYAHHPTESRAALATVKQMFPRRRIWCVFQPHQASRLAALLDEFAASLHNADRIAVANVFRSREGLARTGEPTAADLANLLASSGSDVLAEHNPPAIARRLYNELQPGDVLVTMGAGDLGKIFHEFNERAGRNCAVA